MLLLLERKLPIPWIKVKEFLATQALTKFAWGWMVRAPTKGETTKVQNAVSIRHSVRALLQASRCGTSCGDMSCMLDSESSLLA